VTGVVTKGRGDGRKKHWVTEYRLSYSNDSILWHFYKDEPLQDIKVALSNWKPFISTFWRNKRKRIETS